MALVSLALYPLGSVANVSGNAYDGIIPVPIIQRELNLELRRIRVRKPIPE